MESGLLFRRKIEVQEVEDAIATLRNKRAVGPDGIPGELIKYGGQIMAQHLALLYNHIMEHDQSVQELKMGTLYILNKKGKGSLPEDTRPLVFLSAMRKVLSRVMLNRLLPGVSNVISHAQQAYRAGRSTTEAVWTAKWMRATAEMYSERFRVLGIDLSISLKIRLNSIVFVETSYLR